MMLSLLCGCKLSRSNVYTPLMSWCGCTVCGIASLSDRLCAVYGVCLPPLLQMP